MSRDQKRIVAVALLSADEVKHLGDSLRRVYPVDESPCFGKLLRDVDEADQEVRRKRSSPSGSGRPAP